MISKIINFVQAGIIIVLITLLLVKGCEYKKVEKALEKRNMDYSILKSKWDILINTPPRIIIIEKPVEVNNNNPVIPTPLPHENTVSPTTTTSNEDPVCHKHTYQETYGIGDSISILWAAQTYGIIYNFNILKIRYPYREKIIERFIPPDPCDTAFILKKFHKIRNELWIYVKPQMIFPFKVANVTAGIQWQIKKKWGLGAGVGYDWNINSFIVEPVLLLNIR